MGCCCSSGPVAVERMASSPCLDACYSVEVSSSSGKELPIFLSTYSLADFHLELELHEGQDLWGHTWVTNLKEDEMVTVRFKNEHGDEVNALRFSQLELADHSVSFSSFGNYLMHKVVLFFGQVEIV